MTPAFSGIAVRPPPPYHGDPGPTRGTRVAWHAATPVVDAVTAASRAGFTAYVIGDTYHLKGSQDHTPWSAGKTRGVVYATDIMDERASLLAFMIRKCKDPDTDTRFIHYFNHRGGQYNNAGNRVSDSGDHHLHLSVARGYEHASTPMFAEFYGGGVPLPTPTGGLLMALTSAEQDDIAYTLGVTKNPSVKPLHVRLTEVEKSLANLTKLVESLAKK